MLQHSLKIEKIDEKPGFKEHYIQGLSRNQDLEV